MGIASSTQNIEQTVKQVNEDILKFMITNTTNSSVKTQTSQDLSVENVKAYGCQFSVNQYADIKVISLQEFSPTSASQLEKQIHSVLENTINAATASKTSTFSLIPSMSTSSYKQKALTDLKYITDRTFDVKNLNTMVTDVNNSQTSKNDKLIIDPCGLTLYPNGPPPSVLSYCDTKLPCSINQTLLTTVFAQQITKSLFTQMSNSVAISNILGSTTSTVSATTTDPFTSLIDGIFNGGSPSITGIICMILCCVCCVVLLVVLLQFGSAYASAKTGKGL
jgi:hypothetical protein